MPKFIIVELADRPVGEELEPGVNVLSEEAVARRTKEARARTDLFLHKFPSVNVTSNTPLFVVSADEDIGPLLTEWAFVWIPLDGNQVQEKYRLYSVHVNGRGRQTDVDKLLVEELRVKPTGEVGMYLIPVPVQDQYPWTPKNNEERPPWQGIMERIRTTLDGHGISAATGIHRDFNAKGR